MQDVMCQVAGRGKTQKCGSLITATTLAGQGWCVGFLDRSSTYARLVADQDRWARFQGSISLLSRYRKVKLAFSGLYRGRRITVFDVTLTSFIEAGWFITTAEHEASEASWFRGLATW